MDLDDTDKKEVRIDQPLEEQSFLQNIQLPSSAKISNLNPEKEAQEDDVNNSDCCEEHDDGDTDLIQTDCNIQEKLRRMKYRKNKVKYLIYPEYSGKVKWDLSITCLLLIQLTITPYRIAFYDSEDLIENFFNGLCDFLFFLDIFVIFNSAYYNDDYLMIEDRKLIAKEYIQSWLIVDIVSITPFDSIFHDDKEDSSNRALKLIRMTRLLRIIKIVKERSKILKYLNEILKISEGFERLFYFMIIFVLLCHIVTCCWIIQVQYADFDESNLYLDTWMNDVYIMNLGAWDLYITSFYFTVSTITTVGYGDIRGFNTLERQLCIVFMLLGVISFSFATGSFSSILQSYDQQNAKLQQKISILNRIHQEHFLPLDLFTRLK